MSLCYFKERNIDKSNRYYKRFLQGITETDESQVKITAIFISPDKKFSNEQRIYNDHHNQIDGFNFE